MMRIDVSNERGKTVVKPHGRLDADSAPMLRDTLQRLADGDMAELSLDLSEMPTISSAGLAAWLHVLPGILERSSCTIVGMQPRVKRFLDLAGVLRLVEMQNQCQA